MNIGSKVKIRKAQIEAFVNQEGIVAGMAPNGHDTLVYKVRVGDMILPGWFLENDLEELYRNYTTIIFDLDGTLTDSAEGIIECARYALEKQGIAVKDRSLLNSFVGPSLEQAFAMIPGLKEEKIKEAVQDYRERYFSHGIFEQQLYPGVTESLRQLKGNGYRLAIATTKMMKQTQLVLEFLGIRKYFDAIGARDEDGVFRTKADVLNGLMNYMGEYSSRAFSVVVGDRKFDIEGATQVGLDSVGVLWGYGDLAELKSAGAKHIVKDLDELYALL